MRLIKMIGILVLATIGAGPAVAADPLVPFQANLLDDQGDPLTGAFTVLFKIYDAPQGGSEEWNEEHTTASVVNGRLNVILGDINSLASVDFSTPKYLGVEVGEEGAEMLPRHQLIPAFHAAVAEVALSLGEGAIAMNSVGTAEIAPNAVTGAQLAPNSVGPSNIVDGGVGAAEIAADTVGASEIAAYTVGDTELGFASHSFTVSNNASTNYQAFSTTDRYRFCALTRTRFFNVGPTSGWTGCDVSECCLPHPSGEVWPWTITVQGYYTSCSLTCFAEVD